MSTFNVQSLQWDLLSQRHKLQHLILSHPKYQRDLLALSEMRPVEPSDNIHMVYMEEFLLTHKRRVAFLLPYMFTSFGMHKVAGGRRLTLMYVGGALINANTERQIATVLECARLWGRQYRQLHPKMAVAVGCGPLPHQRALNKDAGSLRPVY